MAEEIISTDESIDLSNIVTLSETPKKELTDGQLSFLNDMMLDDEEYLTHLEEIAELENEKVSLKNHCL